MNLHDLPMVIFTVFTQMSVGTFVALGIMQFIAVRRGRSAATTGRVVDPVMYAVGPTLVFGLAVSMLHMNDITNVFNVMRHWDSSWLSREILFGIGFGAFGFLFALLEWFRVGPSGLRKGVAVVTALLGIGLVWAQSMVYYSLETVPAWHHWAVPVQFFATTVLLGVLAVGAALMVTAQVRARRAGSEDGPAEGPGGEAPEAGESGASEGSEGSESEGGLAVLVRSRVREINAPSTDVEWTITSRVLKAMAVIGAVTSVVILAVYPLYLGDLSQGSAAAQESAAVFSGLEFWARLALAGATAILLGFFVFRMAGSKELTRSRLLGEIVVLCLLLALAGELLGRALHYAAMVRIGM